MKNKHSAILFVTLIFFNTLAVGSDSWLNTTYNYLFSKAGSAINWIKEHPKLSLGLLSSGAISLGLESIPKFINASKYRI